MAIAVISKILLIFWNVEKSMSISAVKRLFSSLPSLNKSQYSWKFRWHNTRSHQRMSSVHQCDLIRSVTLGRFASKIYTGRVSLTVPGGVYYVETLTSSLYWTRCQLQSIHWSGIGANVLYSKTNIFYCSMRFLTWSFI